MSEHRQWDDLDITSKFDTGNGKNIEQVDDSHFRCSSVGDDAGYNYYFALQLMDYGDAPRKITLEVLPDPEYLDTPVGIFGENLNTHLWYTKHGLSEDGWGQFWRFPEFNICGQGELERYYDRYIIRFQTVPGRSVWITNMHPLPYSRMNALLEGLETKHPEYCHVRSLGLSFEGRNIYCLDISEGEGDKPNVLVLSGQHATEFPGQWASWGIAKWLTSRVPEAVRLRNRYRFRIIPQINPDGNVAGRPQKNAEGVNLDQAWQGVVDGAEPEGHENRILWNEIQNNPPVAFVSFHGYCGPRAWGSWPHEGCYVPDPNCFRADSSREQQAVLNDILLWKTNAGSQHQQLSVIPNSGFLHDTLAGRFGCPGLNYEPLDGQGPWNNMRTGVYVLQTVLDSLKGQNA